MTLVLKVRSPANNTKPATERAFEGMDTEFIPIVRSGGWADIGSRHTMEDVFICFDNFMQDFGIESFEEGPSAFYGVCS
jgi:protein phosphatase PTC2/3